MRAENSSLPAVSRLRRRVCAGLVLLALAFAGTPYQAAGASDRADSRDVKAVFLINFLSFAEWPPAKLGPPSSRLTIAILGTIPTRAGANRFGPDPQQAPGTVVTG